jgi:hypothetical protein
MVYRKRNADLVKILLSQTSAGTQIRLWALDEIAPELAEFTVGCGPGMRLVNFNRLYNAAPVESDCWVVLSDDDVFFTKGDLERCVDLMKVAGLSLAQPGQSPWGWWTDVFCLARPFVTARDTNCVEQGPIIIIDPAFSLKMFPLPEVVDMGWGIEALWYLLKEGNSRIGVIDDCRVLHWGKVAVSYRVAPEMEGMNRRLTEAGIDSVWQLRSVNAYWWKWQTAPLWGKSIV